jgi:hypothetical protein
MVPNGHDMIRLQLHHSINHITTLHTATYVRAAAPASAARVPCMRHCFLIRSGEYRCGRRLLGDIRALHASERTTLWHMRYSVTLVHDTRVKCGHVMTGADLQYDVDFFFHSGALRLV